MIFHSPHAKLSELIIIQFCRKRIQHENYVNFLGVLLNTNLNWKHHINQLSKKAYQNNLNLLQNKAFIFILCMVYGLYIFSSVIMSFMYYVYIEL